MCAVFLGALLSTSKAGAQLNKIVEIKGRWSNIFLIRGDGNVLVDSGSPGDYPTIVEALSNYGLKPTDINALVLTHGHADHAGTAAQFRANGFTKVIAGRGDILALSRGTNDELKAMNLTAFFLRPLVDFKFDSFMPDVIVDSDYDMGLHGISARVISMPGHTPGSLVLNYHDGSSFVGDMIAGGIWGGKLFPFYPSQHYFHADRERNQSNIEKLIRAGARQFYVGHGGPLSPEDVTKAFRIPR